jgi:3'(2'), 5'-bisphosphate nucleotidase
MGLVRCLLSVSPSWARPLHALGTAGLRATSDHLHTSELLICSKSDPIIDHLKTLRPHLQILHGRCEDSVARWHVFRKGMQIDSLSLDKHFIGKQRFSDQETAQIWDKSINDRLIQRTSPHNLGDGGALQKELDVSLNAVQIASYISRAYQQTYKLNGNSKVDKQDASPVTVADFAVQAMILNRLKQAFPEDEFVAEEDSALLHDDENLSKQVLDLIYSAFGEHWSLEKLFDAIDLGKGRNKGERRRVWVLDPIDGTKGFLRSQHYCIALGLLVEHKPVLSVLGCPNLDYNRVLQGEDVDKISSWENVQEDSSNIVSLPPSSTGSIFFAVSGHGAFIRSLEMPLGAAYEVSVSNGQTGPTSNIRLCESMEAAHGNRAVSSMVSTILNVNKPYIRVDGMCKHALVGAGAAEATLRLPPSHYIEKVWDHVAGTHFITEAGGIVSDLNGNPLDFSKGRYLSEDVRGVVCSHGQPLHNCILQAIAKAKEWEDSMYL